MASSGTTDFNLDLFDVIEEAFEMVGTEMRSGYDLKTARRSLDLLMREWANRGINFWKISEATAPVAANQATVPLDTDTIDVIDVMWRTGSGDTQNDRQMTRLAVDSWAHTTNKNMAGEPTQFWVNRLIDPVLTIWPVPVSSGTLVYWKMRKIEDSGAYTNTMDIPSRFLPAMTSGLAYYLAIKTPAAGKRLPFLQQEYERQFQLASEEDREKASLYLVPGGYD